MLSHKRAAILHKSRFQAVTLGIAYGPRWVDTPSSNEMIDGSSGSISFILTAISSSRITQINYQGPRGFGCGSLTTTQVTSLSPIYTT